MFILVMHRVAPDDLAGTLQKQGGYFTLSLPLVAEQEETFVTEQDEIIMTRQPGELLNPGRMTPEDLERLKREISPACLRVAIPAATCAWRLGHVLLSTALDATTNLQNSSLSSTAGISAPP